MVRLRPRAPDLEPAKLGKPLNVLYLNDIAAQHCQNGMSRLLEHGLRDDKGLTWCLFLGFGHACFKSHPFRVVNSIILPGLALALHFSNSDPGHLTSAYRLSFGKISGNFPYLRFAPAR